MIELILKYLSKKLIITSYPQNNKTHKKKTKPKKAVSEKAVSRCMLRQLCRGGGLS